MKKNMQGFTLIELMIVVAIIAILAAIALPAYQDFLKRSKVSEVVVAAGACKTSVAEYIATNNALPTTTTQAGCVSQASQYVTSLAVGAGGAITVTSAVAGAPGTIVLTPANVDTAAGTIGSWTCTGTIDNRFKPSTCRTAAP
jgi:type IV pilus assembly protein PilA